MNLEFEIEYLIDNYFKELSGQKINYLWHDEKDSFAYTYGSSLFGYNIAFSKKDYKKMKRAEVLGVLSHELGHISYEKQMFFFSRILINFKMYTNKKYRSMVERGVDKLIIDKGCGEYLLAFMKYHDKKYKKYNKTDGLTKKEIQAYLKINKKKTRY